MKAKTTHTPKTPRSQKRVAIISHTGYPGIRIYAFGYVTRSKGFSRRHLVTISEHEQDQRKMTLALEKQLLNQLKKRNPNDYQRAVENFRDNP